MSDKKVITYKRKRSSAQPDLTKARKDDSSENTEQEMLPKAELDTSSERFDQDSVMPDIGKEAAVKIEPHEAFSRARCDAEIVGESQPQCSHSESMGLTTTETTKNYITAEKEEQPPDLAQNEMVTREETVVEERGRENLAKPQSCTPNRGVVLPDEKSEGEAKETEGLVNFDKALQEFLDMEGIGVHSGQASNRMASSSLLRPVGSSVQNKLNPESKSKGKLPLTYLRGPAHKKHQHAEASGTSNVCANSPDIAGPKISPEDFQNIPSSSNFGFTNSVHQDDRFREIRWPDFHYTTSRLQHQQSFNNPTNAWHIASPDKARRILAPWSEQELDFLWIGVRRHGLNNWNAILKDPILCFLRSRVAEDLAEQWSREHKKLLDDTTPSQPTRPYSAPSLPPPSPFMPRYAAPVCYSGNISLLSGLQRERAETTFSPRGLFIHNENTRGSIPVGRTPVNLCAGSIPARSDYSTAGIRYPMDLAAHNIKTQFETSTSHRRLPVTPRHEVQPPPCGSSGSALPHWISKAIDTSFGQSFSITIPAANSASS